MQDTAPAVYTLAVLVIILYVVDFVVQWRNTRRSRTYTYLQLFLIGLFIAGDAVILVYNQKEAKMSLLHSLQGLSLLQSLIIEVRILPIQLQFLLKINIGYDVFEAVPWPGQVFGSKESFSLGPLTYLYHHGCLLYWGLYIYLARR